ncbi:hypothetical protein BKA58DRAFT_176601 [Alternaria rosae]|uniref:uncharacterized protein n=1 Tax=Alternaria rosae TaxID=1187941 RepID=UPI001E8ECA5C|nr:uncharacterized protein BKA58DRAFT_176601 [Alternaria rosae]KAH6870422.1 hypothetical protein BKA58DRAFT_176601 [Alternaria rosae]
MNSMSNPEQDLPASLKYLQTALTAAEDTHEARSNIFATYGNVLFMGLRIEDHTQSILRMLQSGYDGQLSEFVAKLVEEQPRYFDRPSNIDSFIQQQLHGDNFPTLANVLLISAPATGHNITRSSVLNLLVHQIAYICDLFQKTDYAPGAEVVEALAEYCIGQLLRMFAHPESRVPLEDRVHCARINYHTI